MTTKYNLLDKQWIPVLYRDGRYERVGIRTALEEAGQIRQIAASNPMDRVAILRFLLALLYWCEGNPPNDVARNLPDSFPSDWFSKLEANRECFNLLGEGQRFYQNDAYKTKPPEHTTNYLIHEVPSGTNKWHFRHSTDGVDGLCPACCAMGLIRLPAFATSGGKGMSADSGKSPGINAKPPLYVLPIGESLASTLWMSWRRTESEMGTPAWEDPKAQLPRKGEVPLLTGLTWLPRSVWLGQPQRPESTCIACGRKTDVIRRCVFDGKGSSKAEARVWRDPHVIYTTTRKRDITSLHARDALDASDAAAGQWAGIVAGLLESGVMGNGCQVWVVGFSTVQNDKYLEAMEHAVSLPCLPSQIHETVGRIERWQEESARLARKCWPPHEKESSRKHVEIPSTLAAIHSDIEGRVSAKADRLVSGNDDAWEQAANEYRPMMNGVGKSLSPGFTTVAVQWRRQIAGVMPDMQVTRKKVEKPRRKKGGNR